MPKRDAEKKEGRKGRKERREGREERKEGRFKGADRSHAESELQMKLTLFGLEQTVHQNKTNTCKTVHEFTCTSSRARSWLVSSTVKPQNVLD